MMTVLDMDTDSLQNWIARHPAVYSSMYKWSCLYPTALLNVNHFHTRTRTTRASAQTMNVHLESSLLCVRVLLRWSDNQSAEFPFVINYRAWHRQLQQEICLSPARHVLSSGKYPVVKRLIWSQQAQLICDAEQNTGGCFQRKKKVRIR